MEDALLPAYSVKGTALITFMNYPLSLKETLE